MAYVGVWGDANDYVVMHMNDTLQTHNVNLTYNCPLNLTGTEPICSKVMPSDATNSYNKIDCLQNYEFTYDHNTTQMLINFTYPNY